MANITQTILPVGEMKTFGTLFQEPARFKTSEPMGILNFSADSDVVDAIGAGDTASLVIRQDLPEGFVYRFKDMFLTIRGADSDDWNKVAKFSFFFGVDTPSQVSAELPYPIVRAFIGSLGVEVMYTFGGLADELITFIPFSAPTWLIRGRGTGDTTNPTVTIRNLTASVGPWTTGFLFRYDVFPIEQGDNSGLYWSQPVKEI